MSDLDTTETTQARRRGAPEGNFNAFKHGFYSRRFRNGELDDLVKSPPEVLSAYIFGTGAQDGLANLGIRWLESNKENGRA
jgi:hypothetical protein